MPLILGIPIGFVSFLLIFGAIYIITECKKPRSIFREEAIAEDRILKSHFPKPNLDKQKLIEEGKTKEAEEEIKNEEDV